MKISIKSKKPFPKKLTSFISILFFTALFFLCSADQFFATRIHGFNFRFGQALLFICALISLVQLHSEQRTQSEQWKLHLDILKSWLPFFVIYALAAWTSPTPERSFLKLGWALFNIGSAYLVCLNVRWSKYLERGIIVAVLILSLSLILQAYGVYWEGLSSPWRHNDQPSYPLYTPWPNWPIFGYVQPANLFMNTEIFRPCAFYYVPSFASCSLVFGLCLYFAYQKNTTSFKTALMGGIILCAIILTTSRSGILASLVAFTYAGTVALIQKQFKVIALIFKTIFITSILIGLFMQAPEGRKYIDFLLGPLGPHGISSRITNPESSEGGRIRIMSEGTNVWENHMLLGNGVIPPTPDMQGLGQASENTWVELLMECGTLGFLAFLYAVTRTIWAALKKNKEIIPKLFIVGGILAHFIVSLNFTATYPRLDYWILFFFAIHLLTQKKINSENSE